MRRHGCGRKDRALNLSPRGFPAAMRNQSGPSSGMMGSVPGDDDRVQFARGLEPGSLASLPSARIVAISGNFSRVE